MDRSGAARAVEVLVALLVAGLPLAVVVLLAVLPPLEVSGTDIAWAPAALTAALAVFAVAAALTALVVGLRHGSSAALLRAGASAALAGGAISTLAGAPSMAFALLGATAFLAAALPAGLLGPLARGRSIWAAAIVMLMAETVAIVALLPSTADVVVSLRAPLLAAAVALAALASAGSLGGRAFGVAVLAGVGGVGLLADRGGTFEAVIGLAALVGSQLLALRATLVPAAAEPARLPDLAERLGEAVLHFDGHLQLREWNTAAAGLLGLDAASVGTRLEDLLGVTIAELPGAGETVVSDGAVGGLQIGMHRARDGVTAVIRDPGAAPEAERLGRELRATIEELLRARRTIDLQRGELERASTVDSLTGVASRGAILERLRIEVAQARRYRHPLAVVLLDIDRFGELNQRHGISGGDTVLREVALRVRLRVREADALGRAGSDGFIAALPHTDGTGAATFADALRRRLALRPVTVGDDEVAVTVSIGVATMRTGEDLDLDGLLARVQEALDSARSAGGDRIALDRLHGLARLEERRPPDAPAEDETAQDSGG